MRETGGFGDGVDPGAVADLLPMVPIGSPIEIVKKWSGRLNVTWPCRSIVPAPLGNVYVDLVLVQSNTSVSAASFGSHPPRTVSGLASQVPLYT